MSGRWLFLVLLSTACDMGAAETPAAPEEPVEMGALPEEVHEFMSDGRAGLLDDGATLDVMVPARFADGRWEDLPITFEWNNGTEDPLSGDPANLICAGPAFYAGSVSATVSATACTPFAAANAAKAAANDQIMLDCLNIAMDECAPDLGAGIANDASPTLNSNVAVVGICGGGGMPPLPGIGGRATATASAPCCVDCVELPF